jgi:hypothetical protein
MSLLAGFDMVTEISHQTVLKLILKNLKIGAASIMPTFELNLPISGGGASGTAHLVVTDLDLDLNANDTMTLHLTFEKASVNVTSPTPFHVCPLDGTISITVTLALVNAGANTRQISVALGNATVAITYSPQAEAHIASALAGLPITPATFKSLAVQALTTYVHSVPAPSIPLTFKVTPNTNGSISPLRFEKLELHCIPSATRSHQALGLFGILLVANHAHGNHANKTSSAITAAADGICVSISPEAFHSLVFCPAIAGQLGVAQSGLPATCGSSGGFATKGVMVERIADSFASGHIDIDGSVSKSGFCYDATGTFHGEITFTASGSSLTPSIAMDQPIVDVSIPWYCWLLAGAVLGPLGLVLAATIQDVGTGMAQSLAGSALSDALGSGVPGVSLGALSGAAFSGVSVTTSGLTLQGTVPLFVSTPFVSPGITIDGSVTTSESKEVSSGIFHAHVWCIDHAKDYPYVESAWTQTGTYTVNGQFVTNPFTPHFYLTTANSSATYPLSGSSGTVVLPAVQCYYPMPLATAGNAVVQDVHVAYTISGATVQLTNVPSEGNYQFDLHATGTDCANHALRGWDGQPLDEWQYVQFEGDQVDIGGGFQADVQKCGQLLKAWLESVLEDIALVQEVPIWVEVDFPPPDKLIEYVRDIASIGAPVLDQVLVLSKIAHGNSFYRALFAPAATQPHLLAIETRVATRSTVAELTEQIATLVQRLAAANSGVIGLGHQSVGRQSVSPSFNPQPDPPG